MTTRIVRALFPFSLAFAAALLAKSYASVGDGFSAGAVAGLGAALQYVCVDEPRARALIGARWALTFVLLGLLTALAVLLLPALFGLPPVTHFPRPGEHVSQIGMIEMHTAFVFDLAIAFVIYGTLVATFDWLFPPSTAKRP